MKKPGLNVVESLLWVMPYAMAAVLGIAVYARSAHGPLIWDDTLLIDQLKQHMSDGFWGVFTKGFIFRPDGIGADFYRPLVTLSLVLDNALWHGNVLGFHLTNIFFHVICILSVAWLTQLVLRNRIAAVASAFLFAVHPAHTESVSWISGRTDVMCAAFLLLGACTYLVYREHRKKGFLALSVTFTLLACMSKELAILAPVLFPLLAWASGERDYKRMALDAIPFLVLVAAFYAVRGAVLAGTPPTPAVWLKMARIAIAAYSTNTHLQILLLPHTGKIAYYVPITKVFTIGTLINFLCVMVLSVSLWSNRQWSRIPFFGMAWYLITIAPVAVGGGTYSSGMMAQRFVYLPSVGLAVVFGWLVALATRDRRALLRPLGMLLGVLVIGTLSLQSAGRAVLYADDINFWQRFAVEAPSLYLVHYDLGKTYVEHGRYKEAIGSFQKAADLSPNLAEAYYGIGRSYVALGDYDKAVTNLKKAVDLKPDDPVTAQGLETAMKARNAHSRSVQHSGDQ